MTVSIRTASRADAQHIFDLVCGLAEYEKLRHEVVATPELLEKHLFGPRPYAEVLIAELDGEPVGLALYYFNFSTFEGRPTIFLEDLFVLPSARGHGIGKALLRRLAGIAVERDFARIEWSVLDWNEPAINFYKSLGARPMDDWTIYRVDGAALTALAG